MMVDRCAAPDHWRPLAGRDRHVPQFGSSRAMDYYYFGATVIRFKQDTIPRGIRAI
jgi:hypothetical protein